MLDEERVLKRKRLYKRVGQVLLVLAAVVIVGLFVVFPIVQYIRAMLTDDVNNPHITVRDKDIDMADDNGLLYVNNEIIIMTAVNVQRLDVERLAGDYHASIASSMADLGFWLFKLDASMTYDALDALLSELKNEVLVDDAFVNTVFQLEASAVDDVYAQLTPVYPNDPWGRAGWDMTVPRDGNWGMEAIRAPEAWAYLNRMSVVHIGMIDSMPNIEHEDLSAQAYATITDADTLAYPVTTEQYDPKSHGTHVAGIMAGTWNNGMGVSGVMGDKGRLFCSVATAADNGGVDAYYTAYDYIAAIKTLVELDVKAINISQNTNGLIGFAASRGNANALNYLQTSADILEQGIKRMLENGYEFLICVAAGNSNNAAFYPVRDATYGYKAIKNWIWEIGRKGHSEAAYSHFISLIDDEDIQAHVIVAGSVGINEKKSNRGETRYRYSKFSCVGDRVDIVAPGEAILSSVVRGYGYMHGTSMAASHITGVAGLIFACNPSLTGAETKQIMLASTYSRYYYEGGYSGLVDANLAVTNALLTRDYSVNRVVQGETNNGLDLCFVVDTTGSMGDDIENAKTNMSWILAELADMHDDFRVALVDYRDYNDRSGLDEDYAAKVQLPFSEDANAIIHAINSLDLGYGGDTPETLYAGLMAAVGLRWRQEAAKAIIVIGDAPPHDPEPVSGYTLDGVLTALRNADASMAANKTETDTDEAPDSLIKVYTINTDNGAQAVRFFEAIAENTGGAYMRVENASEVSQAIISSIAKIEVVPTVDVMAYFGVDYTGETVELFRDGVFQFAFPLNEYGYIKMDNMVMADYSWHIPQLLVGGSLSVVAENEMAMIDYNERHWYHVIIALWQRNRIVVILSGAAIVIGTVLGIWLLMRGRRETNPTGQVPKVNKRGRVCPTCGAIHDARMNFCVKCGNKMP